MIYEHKRLHVLAIMQELREIAMSESVKGKHFFLETDMKGPVLKFDTTGKGILTVSILVFLVLTRNCSMVIPRKK